ncbi:hypothetical protein WM41_1459 [Corynebacterium simulans]|uniref:Uncharacterized protein n=1 Tax=Corynebacterium simulans TaxID=146827 RepID=A0ABR5V8X7_9CORY|nr:hypothetical protein WM41_1459 [Corynebacterium simulans]
MATPTRPKVSTPVFAVIPVLIAVKITRFPRNFVHRGRVAEQAMATATDLS